MMAYREQGERPAYDVVRPVLYDYAAAAARRERRARWGVAACVFFLLGGLMLDLATDGWAATLERSGPRLCFEAGSTAVIAVIASFYWRWQARSRSFFTDKLSADTASFLAKEDGRARRLRLE